LQGLGKQTIASVIVLVWNTFVKFLPVAVLCDGRRIRWDYNFNEFPIRHGICDAASGRESN